MSVYEIQIDHTIGEHKTKRIVAQNPIDATNVVIAFDRNSQNICAISCKFLNICEH